MIIVQGLTKVFQAITTLGQHRGYCTAENTRSLTRGHFVRVQYAMCVCFI